jgi:DNA repair protein RecO (recombination protein O)
MAAQYRTQGFVIKKTDRRECDQVFTVFTKDFGRIEVTGKAIRKISSKLKSNIDIFSLCEIEFIQGRIYKTLTDSRKICDFKNIKDDLERIKIAVKVSEAVCGIINGSERDEKVWNLLSETFSRLDSQKLKIENWKLEVLYHFFLWNLLSVLGYKIDLYNCVFCKKKLSPADLFFKPKDGGVAEKKCGSAETQEKEISPETIKILRIILKNDWRTIEKLKINPKNISCLDSVSEDYLSCHKKEEFAMIS